jgi:membrane protein YqaA with SNARE-associated domain
MLDIGQALDSFVNGMMQFLAQTANDPVMYSIVFFVYAVLAAIILPIPVEVGLLLSPHTPIIWLVILLGLGKMLGSVLVFYLGLGVGEKVRGWSVRWAWFDWFLKRCEWLVSRLHYMGLYILLSIPLMSDTVPLYIFSILNDEGVFNVQFFALTNLLAGFSRAMILFLLLHLFGVDLFH